VCFVPRTYLLRRATRQVKEVALGTRPYLDLKLLSQEFPTLLPDTQAAKTFVETSTHKKDGAPYIFRFVAEYAIGDSSLNNTASKCLEALGRERFVNTQVWLRACLSTVNLLMPDIAISALVSGICTDQRSKTSYRKNCATFPVSRRQCSRRSNPRSPHYTVYASQ
jgi:hypothetical protein